MSQSDNISNELRAFLAAELREWRKNARDARRYGNRDNLLRCNAEVDAYRRTARKLRRLAPPRRPGPPASRVLPPEKRARCGRAFCRDASWNFQWDAEFFFYFEDDGRRAIIWDHLRKPTPIWADLSRADFFDVFQVVERPPDPALINGPLSPLAAKMLQAYRRLAAENKPHPCGGFTTDDVQWRMGTVFLPNEEMQDAIDMLDARKLIRYMGHDDEDAIGTCYAATPAGPNHS